MENENALTVLPFSTPVGLNLPPDFTIVAWAGYARAIKVWDVAGQFFLGDLMLYAQSKGKDFEEEATQIVANLRFEPKTLQNAMYMAKRFPAAMRRPGVDYSLYREVAALGPGEASELIDLSVKNDWTVRDLKAEIKQRKKAEIVQPRSTEREEIVEVASVSVSDEDKNCPTVGQNGQNGDAEDVEEVLREFPSAVKVYHDGEKVAVAAVQLQSQVFFQEEDLRELENALDRDEPASFLEVRRLIADLRQARATLAAIDLEVRAMCESEDEMGASDIRSLTNIAELLEGAPSDEAHAG